MSLEWQEPLWPNEKAPEEKIKNSEKQEAVENVEQELSPEVIEMIMEKVQDINKIGSNWSHISQKIDADLGYKKFESVLHNGLLGVNEDFNRKHIDDEHGFTLSFRVPPRLFKGIVHGGYNSKEIVRILREECKDGAYLPIYNMDGNLL